MTIESNFFQKMSKTNEDNINSMDFIINLDLLNGCVHSCEGCFVNKYNALKNWEDVLKNAYEVSVNLTNKGLRLREVILGPTDFFSSQNTLEVLSHPIFQNLMNLHPKTRITAPCIFDGLDRNKFNKIFNLLDNHVAYKSDMIMEFLIPLNSQKIINKEEQYIKDNKWAIDFFDKSTPKIIDWSYVVNIHNNHLLKDHYTDVISTIKSEFNTILEFNPGFFRSNNSSVVNKNLTYWQSFLNHILSENDPSRIYLTNLDLHHNTSNTICLNFFSEGVYVSPFIYEQVITKEEKFKLNDFDADSIIKFTQGLILDGFDYVQETDSCEDCSMQVACVGRNVLSYMKSENIKHCIFPDKFKEINAHTY